LLTIGIFVGWWFVPHFKDDTILGFPYTKVLDSIFVLPLAFFISWRFNIQKIKNPYRFFFIFFIAFSFIEILFFYKDPEVFYNIIGYIIGLLLTYLIIKLSSRND